MGLVFRLIFPLLKLWLPLVTKKFSCQQGKCLNNILSLLPQFWVSSLAGTVSDIGWMFRYYVVATDAKSWLLGLRRRKSGGDREPFLLPVVGSGTGRNLESPRACEETRCG
jgi:hypothetical protein